jgi:hypothetical protein
MPELQTAYEEEDDQSHQILVIHDKPSAEYSQSEPIYQRPKNTVCELVYGQALHSLIGPDGYGSPRYLSAKDVRRWNCLAKLLRRSEFRKAANKLVRQRKPLPVAHENMLPFLHDQDDENIELGVNIGSLLHSTNRQVRASLVLHEKNFTALTFMKWRGKRAADFGYDPLLGLLLGILPIAYGGIHLAVWNSQFASSQESLLWRVACIDTMTTFLAIYALSKCVSAAFPGVDFSDKRIMAFFGYLGLVLLYLFYFLSRLYLVVESFISLRHVPIGVYTTIPWVQNIPHI